MKKLLFSLLFLTILATTFCFGQQELLLEKKSNPKRQKKIDFERHYKIKTKDKEYFAKIIAFSDTSLSIQEYIKSSRDTTYSEFISKRLAKKQFGLNHDTTVIKFEPVYVLDTTSINFSEIEYLKTGWFKDQNWLGLFVFTGMAGLVGIGWLPFAAIKGNDDVKEWALAEGILFGISLPTLFIGTRSTKYDLNKKWTLKRTTNKKMR